MIDTARLQGYIDFLEVRRARRKQAKRQKKIDAGYEYAKEESAYLANNWVEPLENPKLFNSIYFKQGYEKYHNELERNQ